MGEWISFSVAARRLGVSRAILHKKAERGELTSLRVPGGTPKLKESEIEELFASSIRHRTETFPVSRDGD